MMRKCLWLIIVALVICSTVNAETISHSSVTYTIDSTTPAYSGRPDNTGDDLANGTIATTDMSNTDWVQWAPDQYSPQKPAYAYLKFDLGSLQNLFQIDVSYLSYPTAGVYNPEKIEYRLSTDNSTWTNWISQTGFTGGDCQVNTTAFRVIGKYRYVEFKIHCKDYSTSKWLMLSEFTFQNAATTNQPVSWGRFYTYNISPNASYPDLYPCLTYSSGSLLTDTTNGTSSWGTNWVGWYNPGTLTITVDLCKSYSVNSFNIRSCSETKSGIYFPQWVKVYYSTNGTSYTQYGSSMSPPSDTYDYSAYYFATSGSYVTARYVKYEMLTNTVWNFLDELQIFGKVENEAKCLPPGGGCFNGAYSISSVGADDPVAHQNSTQKTLAMLLWYHQLNPGVAGAEFEDNLGVLWNSSNLGAAQYGGGAYSGYRYLTVGWLPQTSTAQDIARGITPTGSSESYDQHLQGWFTDAITGSKRNDTGNTDPIFLRPMNEFNGNWTFPDDEDANNNWGGDPLNFMRAWWRMYNIAQKVGATSLIWQWSPNGVSYPADSWNTPDKYYPGDCYVDWVGISCYPGGDYPSPTNIWQGGAGTGSFNYTGTYGYKPLIISEGGIESAWSTTAARTAWMTNWFSTGASGMQVPGLKAFVWYNEGGIGSAFDFDNLGSTEKNEFINDVQSSYWETTH